MQRHDKVLASNRYLLNKHKEPGPGNTSVSKAGKLAPQPPLPVTSFVSPPAHSTSTTPAFVWILEYILISLRDLVVSSLRFLHGQLDCHLDLSISVLAAQRHFRDHPPQAVSPIASLLLCRAFALSELSDYVLVYLFIFCLPRLDKEHCDCNNLIYLFSPDIWVSPRLLSTFYELGKGNPFRQVHSLASGQHLCVKKILLLGDRAWSQSIWPGERNPG